MEEEDIYKLAFQFIPDIGVIRAKQLISYCGSPKAVFESSKKALLKIPGIGPKLVEQVKNETAFKKAYQEMLRIQRYGIDVHFYLDKTFPKRVKKFDDSPILLYSKGNINWNCAKTVAIIGTRSPSHYGISQVNTLIKQMKGFDPMIISGLAYGIDAEAHRCAIEQGLQTIGILGSGINKIYPKDNLRLVHKMLSHGGVASEFALDKSPEKVHFPMRNRVIASMADVVIVIESARKGGSYITCEFANAYSKDVFAIPGRIGDQKSEGCNHLIKTHKAHLLSSVEDIAYICRWNDKLENTQMQLQLSLDEDEQKIYELFEVENKLHIESIIYQSQMSLSDLSSILLKLEIKGIIKSLPGKNFILTA